MQVQSKRSSRGVRLAQAFLLGVVVGVTAQLFRQVDGPLQFLGAGIAPWVTIGFVLTVWSVRGHHSIRASGLLGAETMGVYLLVWLVSYHSLFVIRESVEISAGWREAFPWVVLAGPLCLALGFVAALTHRRGIVGDASIALPLAWSLPEIVDSLQLGWPQAAVVLAAVALLPIVVSGRRDVSLARVALMSALFGGAAVVIVPIVFAGVRSLIGQ